VIVVSSIVAATCNHVLVSSMSGLSGVSMQSGVFYQTFLNESFRCCDRFRSRSVPVALELDSPPFPHQKAGYEDDPSQVSRRVVIFVR